MYQISIHPFRSIYTFKKRSISPPIFFLPFFLSVSLSYIFLYTLCLLLLITCICLSFYFSLPLFPFLSLAIYPHSSTPTVTPSTPFQTPYEQPCVALHFTTRQSNTALQHSQLISTVTAAARGTDRLELDALQVSTRYRSPRVSAARERVLRLAPGCCSSTTSSNITDSLHQVTEGGGRPVWRGGGRRGVSFSKILLTLQTQGLSLWIGWGLCVVEYTMCYDLCE